MDHGLALRFQDSTLATKRLQRVKGSIKFPLCSTKGLATSQEMALRLCLFNLQSLVLLSDSRN
jgi:hypothetical protein